MLLDFTSAEQRKAALQSYGLVSTSLSAPRRYREAQSPRRPRTSSGLQEEEETRLLSAPPSPGSASSHNELRTPQTAHCLMDSELASAPPTVQSFDIPPVARPIYNEPSRQSPPNSLPTTPSRSSFLPVDGRPKGPRRPSRESVSTHHSVSRWLQSSSGLPTPPLSEADLSSVYSDDDDDDASTVYSTSSSVTHAERDPVAPTMHTTKTIQQLARLIEDDETRRLTELAYA